MLYRDFRKQSAFSAEEMLAFTHGELIDDPPEGFTVRLPTPPMLMIDSVTEIAATKRGGRIVGERRVRLDDWFFQCHFKGDPVQPGCLGVDAIWQLIGFFCAWKGAVGGGRALGCGEVSFDGQIRPRDESVRYEVDIRRYSERSGAGIAIADARVLVDGQCIYTIAKARAGIFPGIAYVDYPRPSDKSRGGLAEV
jgi:3-hydroxyacyl-[acyl-carrier protein] dehydratase/trans-2-decenoyl-[acyl-carrier protein] isomerase